MQNGARAARARRRPHIYRFGPFCFSSELDIPELGALRNVISSALDRTIDVAIDLDEVPAGLEHGVSFGPGCEVSAREYLLDIPGIVRLYAGFGNSVRVQPSAAVPVSDITIFLLGSIFGALCHQNGLLPLHASTVEKNGRVTAFLGDSGAGKSTLAACLQRRGYRILSDDICVLEQSDRPGQGTRVVPVAGWLKLWRESLNHLGETPEERNRTFSSDDKYRVYLAPDSGPAPRLPLGRIVLLAKSEFEDAAPTWMPLSAADALGGMMSMTYLDYVPELTGSDARRFQQCAQVLKGARAYRLTVPWGLDRMESVLDLIEQQSLPA